ncbi:MAG: flagellar hook-length control protein FliK [Pseudomonadota bacterium]
MLPRVDTNIRPVAAIEAPSAAAIIGATKQEAAARFDLLEIGKKIQGEILSRLSDGTFFVKLAGATARMALPQNSKVGESIPLTLVGLTPRPTFLLETGHGTASSTLTTTATFSRQDLIENFIRPSKAEPPSALNRGPALEESVSYILDTEQNQNTPAATGKTIAGTASNIPAEQLRSSSIHPSSTIAETHVASLAEQPDTNTSSTPTNLSDTGKLINKILLQAQQQGAPSALISKTPLLSSAEELNHPNQLAHHLQQTLSSSGLFYESHVADWANGKMAHAELMREPQAQQGSATANITNTVKTAEDHTNLAQIIHLQLDVLEQQKITWQGHLLPGLPFDWEITRQDQHTQTESDEPEASWQSVVRFELPHLGAVAATINFHAGQLQLFLRSETDETVQVLKERSLELMQALDRTGTPLKSLQVKRNE